jgi:hypothetical protein
VANDGQIWDIPEEKTQKSSPIREHDTTQDINSIQIQHEGEFKVIPLNSASDEKNPPNLLEKNYKR